MNRPVKHTAKFFTLVEIMIAMAVLVIMMGFLFQFINSAQKLWSSSTRTASVFETAQIVFDVMETDLKNAHFSNEPGREIPFYRNIHGSNLYLGLMSNYSSSVSPESIVAPNESYRDTVESYRDTVVVDMYPVLYLFDHENKIFYRCAIDNFLFDTTIVPQWFSFGMDISSENYFFNLIDNPSSPFYDKLNLFDIIATGVENVDIQTLPATTGYATEKPRAVKIVLTIYDPEADRLSGEATTIRRDQTRRVFTKIVFM